MKNTTCAKIYFTFLLFLFACSLQGQTFDSTLKKLDRDYQQEKLYLQFDRTIYSPGETIWFKAYLFTGNSPSQISKTLYAELVDVSGKVIQRKTAPVLISGAASSFDIPENYRNSNIYVRAYTKWMLNFDSSFLYSKAITIVAPSQINAKKNAANNGKLLPQPVQPSLYYLQFFPEGGDLAEGIESRVAFKATDRVGIPVNVSGEIIDRDGKKITSFVSLHDGMGTFVLQPSGAEPYKAIWKDQAGQKHETILPAAKPKSIALEVNNYATQIEYKIKHSSAGVTYPFVYIVAQMNQQLLYRARVNVSKTDVASSIIPVENLPTGIMQITVFTPDEKPIAERIVFINQFNSSFITDLNIELKDLDKKKKNVIQIDVPDTLGCNLSVSVTDADLNSLQENDNIFSHVLLASDIKGSVHNPAYYFSGDADSLADNLDLVMMTNGWRRFNWEDALAGHFPTLNYMPENYLSIEGQAYGINKSLLANKEINTIIELKTGNRQFLNTPLQPGGKFFISGLIFYDTAKIFYQFNNDKNKSLTTRASFNIKNNLLKESLYQKFDSYLLADAANPDTTTISKNKEVYKEQLDQIELKKVKTLKTVVVTARKKSNEEIMDQEYTSGLFSGGDARIILPEDDPAFLSAQSVLDYLRGRVAGLQINIDGGDATVTRRGSATALFLNEIQQQDASSIVTLPMSDIAMVKIFDPPFFGASGAGPGGAISIYLKKGVSANQMSKGLDFTTIVGYSSYKEFYSPDYSKQDLPDETDYRKTLYWNPFIITDKNHRRIHLTFYNNDISKKLKIIIEGCNEDGKLTRTEKVFQ